jgi:hypothetical protein
MARQLREQPRTRPTGLEVTVDKQHSTVPDPHPATEERPHVCLEGVVYLGHLVADEDGGEIEVVEATTCRRCERS